ncbi:unnamed protein product [Arctia plantaginis]|uniref:Uncharacterized protein n=1 Tax=Arctia plantaginis TaxID=874455 RepID=A0A8S1ABR1_ARCPL|nr:unnamed protein product [Arctia plantaginis]
MVRFKTLLGFCLDFLKMCFILYRIMIIKALNLNTILWLGGGLMCVFVVCIPLVLMEVAFNDLDEIKIILVDELLTYKELWLLKPTGKSKHPFSEEK